MNHGDLLEPPGRDEAAHPGGSTGQLREDAGSQSMLVPTPPRWDSLLRRVLRSTRYAFRPRRSSSTSTSQQRDTDTATSSSYLVPSSEDSSSRDNSRPKSNTRMVRALFLGLFMFGASLLCTTAFIRLSDAATRGPRGRHAAAAAGVSTSLATVQPPEDLARRIAPPAALPATPAAAPPELNLRPPGDGPPPGALDDALVTATLEPDIKVTTTTEDE